MLRTTILAASRNEKLRHTVSESSLTRSVVDRYVAGESVVVVIATANNLQIGRAHV